MTEPMRRITGTGFKTVSGAGPVREQPHGLLGPARAVTGDGPSAGRGAPRSRPPAIGFGTSSRLIVVVFLIVTASVVTIAHRRLAPQEVLSLTGDVSGVHDPSIIKEGNTYY